jgi:SAM-dependent methyltransferase
MSLNPPTQYATDANFRARQRLWQEQQPSFDLVSWVLDAAGLRPATTARVLDIGCGNGAYLTEMRGRGVDAFGCDLSQGMLAAAGPRSRLVNADVTALPFSPSAVDVVLAPHMLYHVADRQAAVSEMRRVLRAGGRCVVVTNGQEHMRSLRALVESAVRVATPGWEMRNPSTHAFSLENGEAQLRTAFQHVATIRPREPAPVVLTDAAIAADYVASVGDHYAADDTALA